MSKFVFPLALLVFSAGIGFLIFSGRVAPEDQPEMIVGVAVLLIFGLGYLIVSYRDEKRK